MSEKRIPNPEPIAVEITDMDGKSVKLTARRITRKVLQEMIEVMAKNAKLPIEDQLVSDMAWIYGEMDYDNFDIRVLRGAVTHFTDELRNPTK